MPTAMHIQNIHGNVTTKGLEGAIAIHAFEQTNDRPVFQGMGTANHEIGAMELGHIRIHKGSDAASNTLYQYFVSGKIIPKLEIIQYSIHSGQAEWQNKITLSNVLIAHMYEYAMGSHASEHLELAYSKIERSNRIQNSLGKWQTPKRVGFNIETSQPL